MSVNTNQRSVRLNFQLITGVYGVYGVYRNLAGNSVFYGGRLMFVPSGGGIWNWLVDFCSFWLTKMFIDGYFETLFTCEEICQLLWNFSSS